MHGFIVMSNNYLHKIVFRVRVHELIDTYIFNYIVIIYKNRFWHTLKHRHRASNALSRTYTINTPR